jgi:hypothetical protein
MASSGFNESSQAQPSDASSATSEEDAIVVDAMLAASVNPESDRDVQDRDSELSKAATYVYVSHTSSNISGCSSTLVRPGECFVLTEW